MWLCPSLKQGALYTVTILKWCMEHTGAKCITYSTYLRGILIAFLPVRQIECQCIRRTMQLNNKPALIVYPDQEFCNCLERILSGLKCSVQIEDQGALASKPFDFMDYRLLVAHENLKLHNGKDILSSIRDNGVDVPVVLISDQGDLRKAVCAIQNGVHDYFTQNSDERILQESLDRVVKITALNKSNGNNKSQKHDTRPIVTCSDKMNKVLHVARRVAASGATVLIQGESGTGKELLARFIHQQSVRNKKPFVAMNCAALPDNLAESELFGYEKGAFTGAVQNRTGKFEQAHGGTLLLDEISEMPVSLQVKLLRVLQEKEVDPIGGRKPVRVDVRVIATSNRDLGEMVKKGRFREDLYYRLRVIPLTIPPLRERKEDIPLLVECFTHKFTTSYKNGDVRYSSEALKQLTHWKWPGNVRELENTIERAVLICDGPVIGPEHLLIEQETSSADSNDSRALVGMTVKEMEKKLIGQTLKQVNDNRTHAAKMLGISIRTLRNKLREYDS